METLENALQDVEYAFRQLEFAIKLMCYCELGHVDVEKFDTDVTILLERENVGFSSGGFANQKYKWTSIIIDRYKTITRPQQGSNIPQNTV